MRYSKSLACLGTLIVALGARTALTAQQTHSVVLRPIEDASAYDTSPFDGRPESLVHDALNAVILVPGSIETRAVVRFDLGAIRGRGSIRHAAFRIVVVGLSVTPGIPQLVEVRAFTSDDPLDLSDFHAGSFVDVFDAASVRDTSFDVTTLIRKSQPQRFLGLTLRTNVPGQVGFGSLEFEPAPTLTIED